MRDDNKKSPVRSSLRSINSVFCSGCQGTPHTPAPTCPLTLVLFARQRWLECERVSFFDSGRSHGPEESTQEGGHHLEPGQIGVSCVVQETGRSVRGEVCTEGTGLVKGRGGKLG